MAKGAPGTGKSPAACMATAGIGVAGWSLANAAPLAGEGGAADGAIALRRRTRQGRWPVANKRLAELATGGRKSGRRAEATARKR